MTYLIFVWKVRIHEKRGNLDLGPKLFYRNMTYICCSIFFSFSLRSSTRAQKVNGRWSDELNDLNDEDDDDNQWTRRRKRRKNSNTSASCSERRVYLGVTPAVRFIHAHLSETLNIINDSRFRKQAKLMTVYLFE